MYKRRIKQLQSSLQSPLLIKKKENLRYLLGEGFDHGEMWLLVKPNDVVLLGSGLEKMEGIKKTDRFKNIALHLGKARNLGIEDIFTFAEYDYLKAKIKNQGSKIKVGAVRSPVDRQRMVKEEEEIKLVAKSMKIVGKVFTLVKKEIKKPGMTEIRLANFIQSTGLKMGAGDVSFPAIVASGSNASIPHHLPGNKKLKAGESIILDFGFKYKGYCSDFTRTVFLKTVSKKLETAYNQVEKAYNSSIGYIDGDHLENPQVVPIRGHDIYEKSVVVLAEKNLHKYFIHSLGHGTGLEIHELPNLSPKSKDQIQNGMVFSIEPGVYMPKVGGIRIEDLVYLKDGKVKKFINVSTQLKNNIL